ncbi:MAG TPA: LysE family transporter [Nitrospirota bacterium]|jgi:threonine/homoserine/homoserine lactone efflux protein
MESLSAIFAASFVIGFTGALMPGPVLTLTVGQAIKGGWLSGPMIAIGHGLLELLLLFAVVLGLGSYLSSPSAIKFLGLAGGATLAVMGLMAVLKPGGGTADAEFFAGQALVVQPARWALSGALTSAANPYWVLWWATVGLGYLALAGKMGAAGVAAFFAGHILADIVWYTSVSVLISSGRRFMGSKAYYRITAACGLVLIFFGGGFVFMALSK